jgi:hypothetical protein
VIALTLLGPRIWTDQRFPGQEEFRRKSGRLTINVVQPCAQPVVALNNPSLVGTMLFFDDKPIAHALVIPLVIFDASNRTDLTSSKRVE